MFKKQQSDKVLLFIIFILVIFGLVMISSAGIVYSKTRFNDQYYFLKRQLFFGVLPGLLALYIFQKINLRQYIGINE
mgnify:CR=1 FL=1